MDLNLTLPTNGLVTIYPESAKARVLQVVIQYTINIIIDVIILSITHFMKSFKIPHETKKIVFLYCYASLLLMVSDFTSKIVFYIFATNSIKMHIKAVDILDQLYFVVYNIYYITPFCITYLRFILILFNRTVSVIEMVSIAILTITPSLAAFIDLVFFSRLMYRDKTFEYKHWYDYDTFNYLDMAPQLISSLLSIFLNIFILIRIKIERKKNFKRGEKDAGEFSLTINLMFHTICPFLLLIYANMFTIFPNLIFDENYNITGEKSTLFHVYGNLDIIYRIISPITMILFMDVYRTNFINLLDCKRNVISPKSSTKSIVV